MSRLKLFLHLVAGAGRGLLLALVLLHIGLPAVYAQSKAVAGEGQAVPDKETLQKYDKALDEHKLSITGLDGELKSNVAATLQLKAQLEESNVRLFEALARSKEASDKMSAIVTAIEGGSGRKNGAAAATDANALAALAAKSSAKDEGANFTVLLGLLLLLLPLGLSWILPDQVDRFILVELQNRQGRILPVVAVLFLLLGSGLMFGPSLSGIVGNPFAADVFGLLSDTPSVQALIQTALLLVACGIVIKCCAELSAGAAVIGVLLFSLVVYPVAGHWLWASHVQSANPGSLERMGVTDFGGAVLVHSLAASFGCAWAWLLRRHAGFETTVPPLDALPGQNGDRTQVAMLALALGWLGMLALAFSPSSGAGASSPLLKLTMVFGLAGFGGGFSAWLLARLTRFLPWAHAHAGHAVLAGLIASLAGGDSVTPAEAAVIGAVAGLIQVLALALFNKLADSDKGLLPWVFATHALPGVWGSLAVAIFGTGGNFAPLDPDKLLNQALGVAAILVLALAPALVFALIYRLISGLRRPPAPAEAAQGA